jgi:hypothetical protein
MSNGNAGSKHAGDGNGPVVYKQSGNRQHPGDAKQSGDARVQKARRQTHNQVQGDGSPRYQGRPKKAVRLGVSGTFSDVGGEQHPE